MKKMSIASRVISQLEERVRLWTHKDVAMSSSDSLNAKLHGYIAALIDNDIIDVETGAFLYKKYARDYLD